MPCSAERMADPNVQTAPPLYSIWMFNPAQNTILPIMPPASPTVAQDFSGGLA